MSGKGDPLIEKIVDYYNQGDYSGVISVFRECASSKGKLHLITWPLPSEADLERFGDFVRTAGSRRIYSVGCGSGLLEWLMMQFVNIEEVGENVEMIGIEVDSKWWNSCYSPPRFIPLQYYGENFHPEKEGFGDGLDIAIFCYFNNIQIFKQYLSSFRGKFVGLIGPISSQQYCSPGPKELAENKDELPTKEWELLSIQQFGFVEIDFIAIYRRLGKA